MREFIDEYIKNDGNGYKAMQKVHPELEMKKASQRHILWMKKPEVIAYLEEVRSAMATKAGMSLAWVLEKYKMEATGDGLDTKSSSRIRALENLSKLMGYGGEEEVEDKTIKIEFTNDWR